MVASTNPRTDRAREAALRGARQLLMEEGVDSVTHAKVAAHARVSRTTLYKHWPDRESLLRATLEHAGTIEAPQLTGDLRTDLLTLMGLIAGKLRDPSHAVILVSMMQRSLQDESMSRVRQQLRERMHKRARRVIEAGKRSGQLDATVDTDLAIASLFGSLLFRRLVADQPIGDAVVCQIVDRFLAANAP